MEISVCGLGRVGLPLALVLAKAGFKVAGVDVNQERIKSIQKREKFPEPYVNEYLEKYGNRLKVSTDFELAENSAVVIVIPNTPSFSNGLLDVSSIENIVKEINNINTDSLIAISSNINIGTIDKLSAIHNRIVYNPEFIAQGSIIKDFENPKFVLIGAYTEEDADIIADIWRKIHNKPIYVVKPKEAEIIKLSLNISYSLGITFANIIGELCEKFDADSNKVLDIIYQDRRNYKPGLGFGGPCFPRDVNCFKATCIKNSVISGYELAVLLNNLNNYTIGRYYKIITSYGKKRIGILGLAYKPSVPYTDESQSLKIAQKLIDGRFEVFVYDSLAKQNARNELKGDLFFCSSVEECVNKAEVIFIGTLSYKDINTSKPVVNPWK